MADAGSGTPQWAVMGWPGQMGQTSLAALSQTVKMKSICGASGSANSSQDLLRRPSVGMPALRSCSRASGRTLPVGWLPALNAANAPRAALVEERLRHDGARGVSGAEEEDVVAELLMRLLDSGAWWRGRMR